MSEGFAWGRLSSVAYFHVIGEVVRRDYWPHADKSRAFWSVAHIAWEDYWRAGVSPRDAVFAVLGRPGAAAL